MKKARKSHDDLKIRQAEIPSDGSESDSSNNESIENEVHTYLDENSESDESFEEEEPGRGSEFSRPEAWNPKWRKEKYECTNLPRFSQYCGPNEEIYNESYEASPMSIFRDFIDDDILNSIAFQTNLYAAQKDSRCKPTDAREIETFIGIHFLMAMKKQPSYRDCWSTDPFYNDQVISNAMSFYRFSWLLSHIHLNDNSTAKDRNDSDYDKLHKVRPFLDHLENKFKTLYSPSENQSIDESMIKFKDRSSLKQYRPEKPIKRGYKIWVRADKNGYISDFGIHTGNNSKKTVNHGLGESVIHSLSQDLVSKGYKIYADNFFSSVPLAKSMAEKGLGYCGTIRNNLKHFPMLTKDKVMNHGDYDYRMQESAISCVKLMGTKKSANFISNFHDPTEETTIFRKNKNGSTSAVSAPTVVCEYRNFIGGVDKADMLKSFYEIDRRTRKWWIRIFFHFLDVCVVNAFIIYNCLDTTETMTLKNFKIGIVAGLLRSPGIKERPLQLKGDGPSTMRQKTRVSIEVRREGSDHLPLQGPTFRRCNHCSTRKEPHRTRWMCSLCNVALCNTGKRNCFTLYHK